MIGICKNQEHSLILFCVAILTARCRDLIRTTFAFKQISFSCCFYNSDANSITLRKIVFKIWKIKESHFLVCLLDDLPVFASLFVLVYMNKYYVLCIKWRKKWHLHYFILSYSSLFWDFLMYRPLTWRSGYILLLLSGCLS